MVQESLEATASPGNPTNGNGSLSATHRVQVGGNGQRFSPNSVNAAVGDVIEFHFLASNHTVTHSTLEQPCQATSGLDSGFQYFNPINQTGVIDQRPLYLVTDSQPRWLFCRQTYPYSHCGAGMIFSINGGDLNSEFQANAARMGMGTTRTTYNMALVSNSAVAVRSPSVIASSPNSAASSAVYSVLFLTINSSLPLTHHSRRRQARHLRRQSLTIHLRLRSNHQQWLLPPVPILLSRHILRQHPCLHKQQRWRKRL